MHWCLDDRCGALFNSDKEACWGTYSKLGSTE
jgi:hypothetical protein